MLRILLIPMWVMVFGLLGCDQEVEKKSCTGCNNNEPDCDDPRATCPPCPVELCACRQDPPDCTICLNPDICPDRPDGGTDVTDIVQPDIPDAETDPYLSMVECGALQTDDLPGYLTMYGTWENKIFLGTNNYPSLTERFTKLYMADLETFTISELGQVPDTCPIAPIAMIVEELNNKAYFITSRWETPVGCTDADCRFFHGTLWGIDLETYQIAQESHLPLESDFCLNHHGVVFISAIDTQLNWLTVDCELLLDPGEGSTPLVAYETYRVHLVSGEIQYLSHAEDRLYVPTTTLFDSGHGQYRFTFSHEWNADRTSWTTEPIGFHIWDLSGAVPLKVYEEYYPAGVIASGRSVGVDGWYYWSELVEGDLQIRGMDVVTGSTLTTTGSDHEKGTPLPAGKNLPHFVSYHGGTNLYQSYGMVLTEQEGIHLWDKELNVTRKATTNLPFAGGAFFNGTDSTRWFLLIAEIGDEMCLFVRDLHAAGVIDPLTNRLLPEPDAGQ